MNKEHDTLLFKQAAELPAEIQPESDLWPGIAAQLGAQKNTVQKSEWRLVRVAAAGIALIALSSLVTWNIAHQADDSTSQLAELITEPARPFVADAELQQVRATLTDSLDASLARFQPDTRKLIIANLLEIQRGLNEIQAALEQDPNNVLLHQLLYRTYEQELALISEINQVANTLPTEVEI